MTAQLITRQPTGKAPWPTLVIAGRGKTGKSYAAAAASASTHIGRTLWIGIGERDPDEYQNIPGARFEIVQHDGTAQGILASLDAACAEPPQAGKPNLIVIDSVSRFWDLLSEDAQHTANERAKKRGGPGFDAQITMDLWNTAKQKWQTAMTLLQAHPGPSVLTARLELVSVVENGKPKLDRERNPVKEWKVKGEKSLPFDVDVTIELPVRGEAYLTGVRSLRFQNVTGERTPYRDFTVQKLWADMGITDQAPQPQPVAAAAQSRPQPEKKTGPEMASGETRKELVALYNTVYNIDDPASILEDLGERFKRTVNSTSELTATEAASVITKMREYEQAAA